MQILITNSGLKVKNREITPGSIEELVPVSSRTFGVQVTGCSIRRETKLTYTPILEEGNCYLCYSNR